jgi:hypothetical protein
MAMKIVEIRIMLRGRPSSPLVPWLEGNAVCTKPDALHPAPQA